MNENNILLIPDLDRLRQRFARPPPPLGELLARFRQRLDEDAAFRAANLYLPALLGEEWALHEFGLRRVALVLGLAPRDGYLFEGSTYQSHVVSPLVMWTAAFLSQLNGPGALAQRWPPVGATLLDILRVETLLGSAGRLLPPWDHYGWQPKVNLAVIAYYASATGRAVVLADAPEMWDHPQQFIAWGKDDRMWALIYWPDRPIPLRESAALTSWSLPRTAAAIDHTARRARLMLTWDNSASWLQMLGRVQVNPNHVAYELDGKPVFADGTPAHSDGFLEVAPEAVAAALNTAQRELIARQFGSIARWANGQHGGLIGAANTVFLDDDSGYFPPSARHGQLCFEERGVQRHVTTAECVEYFRPRYDLTQARRTIAMNADGVCWIADDYRAAILHTFTWQVYVRLGGQLFENCLGLRTSDGLELTMAWLPVDLRYLSNSPETNTALRARWAAERMAGR